jgi:hypothetical protein
LPARSSGNEHEGFGTKIRERGLGRKPDRVTNILLHEPRMPIVEAALRFGVGETLEERVSSGARAGALNNVTVRLYTYIRKDALGLPVEPFHGPKSAK